MVVPWKDTLFKSIPEINDKDNKIVFDGEVRPHVCVSSARQKLKFESIDFMVNRDPNFIEFDKFRSYTGGHYFFFMYKPDAANEVHLVGIDTPRNKAYTPWYGPLLAITLPVAFVIDVVAFPIEMFFYSDGEKTLM